MAYHRSLWDAGLFHPDSAAGAALTQRFTDSLADILFGKRPVSDLDALVKDWRANGGDTIRSEYEQALQASRA